MTLFQQNKCFILVILKQDYYPLNHKKLNKKLDIIQISVFRFIGVCTFEDMSLKYDQINYIFF